MNEYLSESYLRSLSTQNPPLMRKTASFELEKSLTASPSKKFDVFLSHSFNDAEIIRGIKLELESKKCLTYVDWIEEPNVLSRNDVGKKTAHILRERMKFCSVLIYAYSINSASSVWMPWELGYCDGLGKPIAIMPISGRTNIFKRQEYLELYPFITREISTLGSMEIWVNENVKNHYIDLVPWIAGKPPYFRI